MTTVTVVAVSGTIEEGFELRKNIDSGKFKAVFLGQGMCRGAKMYFDIKEKESREYGRVNPAMVLTGNANDANVYSLYLVEEGACLNALLGEPRFLSMVPDALRVDLRDSLTSPQFVEFAKAQLGDQCESCCVLSVVSSFKSCRFVEAPAFESRPDGTKVTQFRKSLALFAGLDIDEEIGSIRWKSAVTEALANAATNLPSRSESSTLYCEDSGTRVRRLSTRFSVDDAKALFDQAGLGAFPRPQTKVDAQPYPFPLDGDLDPEKTALVVIDLQRDFTEEGGYATAMGLDLEPLAKPVQVVKRVLSAARAAGLKIIHTRQGFRPDLADLPKHTAARFKTYCDIDIGTSQGPLGTVFIRGQPGWHINQEVAPLPGEPIVDKTANSAFVGTDLQIILNAQRISNLIFCGNTLDVCVHCTMRHAADLNYQTCIIEDGCGCADSSLQTAMIDSVKMETGIFGSVTQSDPLVSFLEEMARA